MTMVVCIFTKNMDLALIIAGLILFNSIVVIRGSRWGDRGGRPPDGDRLESTGVSSDDATERVVKNPAMEKVPDKRKVNWRG
jgi:hypothetical protein